MFWALRFWRRPEAFLSIPVGLPITAKLTWLATMNLVARRAARLPASFTTRRSRASARRCDRANCFHRREPVLRAWPGFARRGLLLVAIFLWRAFWSSRCKNSSALTARPETSRAWSPAAMAKGWMIPGSTPATFSVTALAWATATQAVMSVRWGLVCHRASRDGYKGLILPIASFTGTA